MKRIFIFGVCVSILTLLANGQAETLKNAPKDGKADVVSSTGNMDTIPTVEHVKAKNVDQQPVCYINGKLSNLTILKTIDPALIDSIHIEKKDIEIGGTKYYGQIYIKMKGGYNPQMISLSDLAKKYANLKNGLTVLLIDNELINDDYEKYLVDEKYIFKIIVDTIKNVDVVQLLTRSKENIEKSKQIVIRGLEEMTLN